AVHADADTIPTRRSSELAITGNVLSNDNVGSDDPVHVAAASVGDLIGTGLGGTLHLQADGSYSYDPHSIPNIETKALGTYTDTFTYTAQDGHGDTASATLTITVTVDPETVSAVADTNAVSESSEKAVRAHVLTQVT